MVMDAKLVLSDSQDLGSTLASAAVNTTNTLNLGARVNFYGKSLKPNIGEGNELWLHLICEDEDFSCSSCSITFDLKTASNASFTSATDLLTFTFDADSVDDGDLIKSIPLPQGVDQYVRGEYTPDANITDGKVTCWIGGRFDTPMADRP